MQCLILRLSTWTIFTMFGAFIIICSIFSFGFPACIGWIICLLFLLRSFADPSYLRLHVWKRISGSPFSAFVLNQLSTALFYVGLFALAFMLKDTVGFDGCEAQISLSVEKSWWKPAQLSDPLTFTVTLQSTMEGTFSVMILAVFYSGEAGRSVCGSHAALSYVNQFLLLATGLCFTPCTFIIPSNTIHGLGKGDTACAGIDLVTCNDYDKVEIGLLYVSTTADMDLFGTMIVAFGRSDSCSKNSCMFSEYTNSDALLHCASEGDVFLRAGCYTTVAIWILVTSWYIYNKKLRCHPHTFTVTRNTMEGTFSVMIFAVSYSGEAGRSVCGSHAALSYVNQFLLLATGLCLTPCTFIIPSNTIYGLGKGDTACAGIDLVTCNDCDKVEIGLLYVSTTTDMDLFGTMIVAFGRSDSCSKNSCMFSEYTNSDALLHCASEGDVFLRAGCYTTVAIWILVTSWYIYNKKLRCHPHTFTVSRNTMEGTFSVMIFAVSYSGEAGRSVCGSHAALSYVNQFLLLATGLCLTPCTFIIPSNTIYGLGKGDTACAGIDLVTCNDCDKVEIGLLYVSTTTDMDLFGTMIVAFGRSDSCSKNSCMFSEYTNSDALLHCASEGDVFLRAGCYTTVAIWILVTSWYIYNKKLRCHPHTFTVTRNTMEGTFSVMILAVFYSGEAGRSVCGSHAALSYVNQFLLLATGLCFTPCTFIIPSNAIHGLSKGDTACAGIDLVTCNDYDKVEIGLLYVSTTADMALFGTMIVAFGRSDSCSKNSCMFSEYTNSDALLNCASEGDVFLRAGCYTTVAIWILVTSWYIYNKKLRCHPHTFTVSRNTMEGTFSVMIFAVSYSGEAGRSVCGSHAALSYVNQFLLLATGLCLTPCTFIIPSNTIYGLGKGDTACAGIDLVTCNDCDKVEIGLLYVSTTTDMDVFGTMIVAFGRSDSCSKNSCMFSEYTNSDALLHCASEGDVFLRAGCYTTVAIWILVTSWYIYNKKLRCHPHTFTVSRNTMEGTFSVMIFAVSYSGEAGRSVCGSHAALSYVNQFLLLATGLCLTPCTFIIPRIQFMDWVRETQLVPV